MKKLALISIVGLLAVTTQAQAVPTTYNAFDDFVTGAGNNNSNSTWQYLAAKYQWANSQATHLPDYSYRDYSTATQLNNNNSLGLTLPRGERHVWKSRFTYTGSVSYDTGLEWTGHTGDPDGDGVTETIEHIHMSPGFTGVSSSYLIADTLLAFSPDINIATLFNFSFDIASDYHVSGAADCAPTGCPGSGQRLGLFLNDSILSPDLFWVEDNNAANGSKIASGGNHDDWVHLPDRFARFDDPVSMDFALQMNPGDTFYLRLNNNGYTLWDGIILTEAVASAMGTGGGSTNTVPEPPTLLLLLAALPFISFGKRGKRNLPSLQPTLSGV